MKRCTGCGQEMTRPHDHNCGYATVTKDELRTLREQAGLRSAMTEERSDG